MMKTTRRTAAVAALMVAALAGCTGTSTPTETTTDGAKTATAPVSAPPAAPETQSPETRVTGYFAAFDAAAAKGWPDTGYNAEYLTPDLAAKADTDDQANAATGETITGERHLSEWTVLDESDTSAVVEFCNNTADRKATKDGQPVDVRDVATEAVGRFTLTRADTTQPYLISEMGYYPEGTTCADHFAQYGS
ncbi:hypothetical protein ACT3TZ_14660 [Brachybacterium sp. AOP25-B2-12]|uniref:hypothetical protein n=1 Tax=Brachybacterium sp. AOP25-B2-12 TaxID=3457710 RepID=UPI0040347812